MSFTAKCLDMEHSGEVLSMGHHSGSVFSLLVQPLRHDITFYQFPSKIRNVPKETWTVHLSHRVSTYGHDSSQGLLAVLETR